jgi:mannose-1-phosphate guanylyltransferase
LRPAPAQDATLVASLPAWGSRNFSARVRETFPLCEKHLVDYAVLEKSSNVVGVAGDDIGWNDVGSWNAVYELLPQDASGNVLRSDRGSGGCLR